MKRIHKILLLIVLPVLLVSTWSYISLKDDEPNGFSRIIKKETALKLYETHSDVPLIQISGVTKHKIYFTTPAAHALITFSTDLTEMSIIRTKMPNDQAIRNSFSVEVDAPNVTLFAGNIPAIYTTDLNRLDKFRKLQVKGALFNEAVQFARDRFIIRQYAKECKDFIFKKIGAQGTELSREKNSSVLLHDDGISSQGTLLFSPEENRIYYVYKLFNSILCLDTNLTLIYHSHTIDTISKPNLKTEKIRKNSATIGKYASPPRYTNFRACLEDGSLYIYSRVRADNQENENDPVVDVYRLWDGEYQYSFYLPGGGAGKLSDFKVFRNTLIALYDKGQRITVYELKTSDQNILARSGEAENL